MREFIDVLISKSRVQTIDQLEKRNNLREVQIQFFKFSPMYKPPTLVQIPIKCLMNTCSGCFILNQPFRTLIYRVFGIILDNIIVEFIGKNLP